MASTLFVNQELLARTIQHFVIQISAGQLRARWERVPQATRGNTSPRSRFEQSQWIRGSRAACDVERVILEKNGTETPIVEVRYITGKVRS